MQLLAVCLEARNQQSTPSGSHQGQPSLLYLLVFFLLHTFSVEIPKKMSAKVNNQSQQLFPCKSTAFEDFTLFKQS